MYKIFTYQNVNWLFSRRQSARNDRGNKRQDCRTYRYCYDFTVLNLFFYGFLIVTINRPNTGYLTALYIITVYDNRVQAYRSDRWTGMEPVPEGGLYVFNNTIVNYLNVKAK